MKWFTMGEFKTKYIEYDGIDIPSYKIDWVCEMIFSIIGLRYRQYWDVSNVPLPIKEASMEQLRFMIEHDIPFVDFDKELSAGPMKAKLKSDYSTLALRILANAGLLYRGNTMSQNMSLDVPFGGY